MVQKKQYKELSFEHHIDKHVEIIDMKAELLSGNTKLVSITLDKAIQESFSKKSKSIADIESKRLCTICYVQKLFLCTYGSKH